MLDLKNSQTTLCSPQHRELLAAGQHQPKPVKTSEAEFGEFAQTSYDQAERAVPARAEEHRGLMTGKDNLIKARQNELQASIWRY